MGKRSQDWSTSLKKHQEGSGNIMKVEGGHIGAKPNLYCKAIELVCGGSPKVCVLVE